MKKTIILISLFFITNFLNAQTEKGRISIGGTIGGGFSNDKSEYDTTSVTKGNNGTITVSPNANFFVKKGLSINPSIIFQYSHSLDNDERTNLYSKNVTEYKRNAYNIGVGIGLTKFFTISDKFYFTLSPSISYTHSTSKNITDNSKRNVAGDTINTSSLSESTYNGNNFNFYLAPGFAFSASKRILLSAGFGNFNLGYSFGKTKNDYTYFDLSSNTTTSDTNESKSNNFDFGLSLRNSLYIGFNYYLK